MARKLIIDTGALIAAERGGRMLQSAISPEDDVAIAAITLAELYTGIELADDRFKAARAEFVLSLRETIPVESYGLATAEAHGRLLAFVRRSGAPRGAHDLIIAATAIATGRTLITSDHKADFAALPGLDVVQL